ncbi:hypothetical protein KXR83_16565 [Williamsia muralis]|uniref:hypothetical protein n=1 Tax=Williamsia marianensis TaxID=85044 RepID=UPI003F166E52
MDRIFDTTVCNEADRAEQQLELSEDVSGTDEYPYTDHSSAGHIVGRSTRSVW